MAKGKTPLSFDTSVESILGKGDLTNTAMAKGIIYAKKLLKMGKEDLKRVFGNDTETVIKKMS